MAPSARRGHQGWLEESFDAKDQYYKPPDGLEARHSVNLRKEYPSYAIDVYDQGGTETCVANASAAALWYELKKADEDTVSPSGPSRLFIYWNARTAHLKTSKTPKDKGTFNRTAMKSLDKLGACRENSWMFIEEEDQIQARPPSVCYEEAKTRTISAYFRLDPDRPSDKDGELTGDDKDTAGELLLTRVKICLTEGYPIVFGFRYYWDAVPWDENSATWILPDIWKDGTVEQRHTSPKPPKGKNWGGHAVLMVGYDDDLECVLCQNSWGEWGSKGGLFYMPYSWITDFAATNDFWTIRTSRAPTVETLTWTDFHPLLGEGKYV